MLWFRSRNDVVHVLRDYLATRDVEEYTSKNVTKLPSRFFIKTYISTYQHGSALDKVDTSDETAAKLLKYVGFEFNDKFLWCTDLTSS